MPVAIRPTQHSRRRACTAEPAHPRQPASRPLATAISALLLGGAVQAYGQSFPASIDVGALDVGIGFRVNGEMDGDQAGAAVSGVGDFNGDDLGDVMIGAPIAAANGELLAGRSYVLFGTTSTIPAAIELSNLNGLNGFALNGAELNERSGRKVKGAGDINGDGFEDLLIGASGADPNGNDSGRSYLVFGTGNGVRHPLNLSSLDGTNGFALNGESSFDIAGTSVSTAGDMNGDGIDDFVIGAPRAEVNGIIGAGRCYVVFGSNAGFPNPFELSSLSGGNGFIINGEAVNDYSGSSVDAGGDINGDGIDDLIIGAYGSDANANDDAGRSYVVFGSSNGFNSPLDLSGLDGTNGFKINGENAGDISGFPVAGAGDINGDGFHDVVIGAYKSDPNGKGDAGRSFVIFGSDVVFSSQVELSSLDGTNGFAINGEAAGDYSGRSVSGAGDINGDGKDDLIIGAPRVDVNGINDAGRSYVIFGFNTVLSNPLELSSLDGDNGFALNGDATSDFRTGLAGSSAGDFNGDGIADLIIGAPFALVGGARPGGSYVLYGRDADVLFTSGFEAP